MDDREVETTDERGQDTHATGGKQGLFTDEFIGAWGRVLTFFRERLLLGCDDEDESPEETPEPDLHSPQGSSCTAKIALLIAVIALGFVLYHHNPPSRKLMANTVSYTLRRFVGKKPPPVKPAPPPKDEPFRDTLLPEYGKGDVMAGIIEWLGKARPDTTLGERIEESELIAGFLVDEVAKLALKKNPKALDPEYASVLFPYSIQSLCIAGDPHDSWLILAVGRGDLLTDGYVLAVRWNGSDYKAVPLNHDVESDPDFVQGGLPWLKACDLDRDGDYEIVETWRQGTGRFLHVRVHNLLHGSEWKRVWSFPGAYYGQIRIMPSRSIRIGVGDSGRYDWAIESYRVMEYGWNRRAGTLLKTREYESAQEFASEDAGGMRSIPESEMPGRLLGEFHKSFKEGWFCSSIKMIEGHRLLRLCVGAGNRPGLEDEWAVIADRKDRVVLADEGWWRGTCLLRRVEDFDGDSHPEALLELNGGGAHGNFVYYLVGFHPEFRVLVRASAGRGSLVAVEDLDHDGRKEIVLTDECVANYDDLPCADSPFVPIVLACRDGRYVDATRDYSRLVLEEIADARKSLISRMSMGDETSARDSQAIRWLACAAAVGREDEAYAEIMKIAVPDLRSWLTKKREGIVSAVRRRDDMLTYAARTLSKDD